MDLQKSTLELVKKEKFYTAKILDNLVKIEKQKLYSDWRYPSLYKYLTKGLGYSEGEANIRINAVRLMMKSKSVSKKIASGKLSLTNAAIANQTLNKNKHLDIEKVIDAVSDKSTRHAQRDLYQTFELKTERRETLSLDERMLTKMDKLKDRYGVSSTYELIDILVEEKLKKPEIKRPRNTVARVSRSIPKTVKAKVWEAATRDANAAASQSRERKARTSKCSHILPPACRNCGSRRNLEYDHIKSHSLGGDNGADNLQILCRACNQRKYLREKHSTAHANRN